MAIVNNVPELVAQKFGGDEKVNIAEVQRETGMTYATVYSWMQGRPRRADFDILDAWCRYLNCQVGDLLVHVPNS